MLKEPAKPFAVPPAAMAAPAIAMRFGPAFAVTAFAVTPFAMAVPPPVTVMMTVAVALEEFHSHVFVSSVCVSMYRNYRYIEVSSKARGISCPAFGGLRRARHMP
jgi:hypothetical protein